LLPENNFIFPLRLRIAFSKVDAMKRKILLGKRVFQLRVNMNLGLRGLAKASGVSYGNISKIENGLSDPALSTLDKLAKAFGITASELIR
jgi:predicted transcriptional regulator